MNINPNPKFWFKEVTVKLEVLTLLAVHGNLLLALRHPLNIGESRDLVVKFVKDIGYELVFLGAIKPEQLLETYVEEVLQGALEFDEDMDEITAQVKEIAAIKEQMMQRAKVNDEKLKKLCDLKYSPFILQEGERGTEQFIMTNTNTDTFQMIITTAKCCGCGKPMSLSQNMNFMQLDKKAKWKYPVWDNLLLKPGIERIPRAMAVMCDACMGCGKLPAEVIEIEGKEIQYHKVTDLEDAFEITPEMVITNIKDLRE